MTTKKQIIIYTILFIVTLLIQTLIPIFTPLKDMLYIVPIIVFLLLFLIYNHFALVKSKKDYKKEKYDIEAYKLRRKIIFICMLIEILLFAYGMILYNFL